MSECTAGAFGSAVKRLSASAGDKGLPWVRKIPWRRKWQLIPVLLPGEFHGQQSLAGYSPRGCKELDANEQLNNNSSNKGQGGAQPLAEAVLLPFLLARCFPAPEI